MTGRVKEVTSRIRQLNEILANNIWLAAMNIKIQQAVDRGPAALKDVPSMISSLEEELAELTSQLGKIEPPNNEAYESLLRGAPDEV